MYKDKSSTAAEATPQESEFVRLDDLPEVTVQCRDVSNGESGSGVPIPIIPWSDSEPSTLTAVVHRNEGSILWKSLWNGDKLIIMFASYMEML
ncbi:hypothetical protein F0562_018245 [Nyssa sinensis]|uniref:Uncharacterized protein n=1 Tax=Nyssa sinensis TaxID=561372 RepID=A0A5J4ZBK3_9ASTE|nr:hypothetical protein F0562_018245 [Nyssa sinensis]